MKNTLTSVTCFNGMTFVLTETVDKKRLLIVMSSDIIPFAFGNIGRLTSKGKNRSSNLRNSGWSSKNHGLDRNGISLKTCLIIN